jgi:hypothetical protein
MEGLKSFHDRLKNLQPQGKRLIETMVALNALFAEDEIRQKREDEVSILMAVRCAIVEQLEELKRIETAASLGHSQGNIVQFPIRLVSAGIFLKNSPPSATMDYLLRGSDPKHRPFGTVMVCVGPKGLPDDAKAVSISQLARNSNRLEPQIVNGLQADSCLVFTEEAFSLLIDRMVVDIREGKLHLPVSGDNLAEIAESNKPKSRITIVPIKIGPGQ